MALSELENIIDIATLEQYCAAIGATTLLKSVLLFEQLLPEYIDKLVKANEAQDKEGLCSEAHKFKGAAGSIGLRRVQQIAQQLQHGDEPGWDEGHKLWTSEITTYVSEDLTALKSYLSAKT